MNNVLYLFTGCFPYGKDETFIENEIEYLGKAFDKVIIISNDTQNALTRIVPENTKLYRLAYTLTSFQKLLSIRSILSKIFWNEIFLIRNTYKLKISKGIFNTMCQTLQKAKYWYPKIHEIVKENEPSNTFFYSYWSNDSAFAIAYYKRRNPDVRAFSRVHGSDLYFEANNINYLPYRKLIFNELNSIYAISQKGMDYYKKWLKLWKNKSKLSRLGTRSYGINPTNPTKQIQLLTISNSVAVKNLEVLIDALALLKIPFYWTHFGDGILQESLFKRAEKEINNKFVFKGMVPNTEVLAFLKSNPVDIILNVSLTEGIPVSIMEAMSFGIPAFAAAVGGTPEIVNNENGYLFAANPTPEQIAERIRWYYYLPDKEKNMKREAAYNTWNEKFNAEKNYSNFVNEILNL